MAFRCFLAIVLFVLLVFTKCVFVLVILSEVSCNYHCGLKNNLALVLWLGVRKCILPAKN